MKAAYYDPNPVVMLEHKGLYWSKIKGTEKAMSVEPSDDYVVPIGKARIVEESDPQFVESGESIGIISYGRGIYWSLEAMKAYDGQIELLDLRSLNPLDHEAMNELCQKHSQVIIVTEESVECSFALGLAGRLQRDNFKFLDAPIQIVGSVDTPAIPLNSELELALLPNANKIAEAIEKTLKF